MLRSMSFKTMNRLILFWLAALFSISNSTELTAQSTSKKNDSLPSVLSGFYDDLIEKNYLSQAALAFRKHQLPDNVLDWRHYKSTLKSKIIEKSAAVTYQNLALNMQQTGFHQLKNYSVRNISFQTRPSVLATANLYVPDGEGPFPAVLAMHGHWPDGKSNAVVQSLGHTLALNGYVCLVVDAFGAGERTTLHGTHEYHGSNLGASLMNIGHTLIGEQISDNIRAIDLLSSLPYVDQNKIGATGASGGGNQTMWLSALDERIQASMPVVSVGSFESYIMKSNCVCELLPGGLTLTEEAGVLAMIAPRALHIATALQDANPTFTYPQMLKSFQNAQPVFQMLDAYEKISYQLFDTGHGYWPQMRQNMLGFFDLHLKAKGTGAPKQEIHFSLLSNEQLMVYKTGRRDSSVITIERLAQIEGRSLIDTQKRLNGSDLKARQQQLQQILGISVPHKSIDVHSYGNTPDGWQRIALETSAHQLLPLLYKKPKTGKRNYTVILNISGKNTSNRDQLAALEASGEGIILADLWGIGEYYSQSTAAFDKNLTRFHTLARASLWLGESVIGHWINNIDMITELIASQDKLASVTLQTEKEIGLAALFYEVIYQKGYQLVLQHCPVSYLFDSRENVDYFGMGIHIPGILKWGDIPMAAGIAKGKIVFENPVSMSGRPIEADQLQVVKSEFERMSRLYKRKNPVTFK